MIKPTYTNTALLIPSIQDQHQSAKKESIITNTKI